MNNCSEKYPPAIRILRILGVAPLALTAAASAPIASGEPSVYAATISADGSCRKPQSFRRPAQRPPLPVKRCDDVNAASRPTAETAGQRLLRKGYFESRSGAPDGGR